MRGKAYKTRPGAAQSYREVRTRARALGVSSWAEYQKVAREQGLPTQPQAIWPDQFEADGYSGFIGTGGSLAKVQERGLVSAEGIRKQLGIGHKTWKTLAEGLRPASTVAHKVYYDKEQTKAHLLANLDRIGRTRSREALGKALGEW